MMAEEICGLTRESVMYLSREDMASDYPAFKSSSCYLCNTEIIVVSYLGSRNKNFSISSIRAFPKLITDDLRCRNISNV